MIAVLAWIGALALAALYCWAGKVTADSYRAHVWQRGVQPAWWIAVPLFLLWPLAWAAVVALAFLQALARCLDWLLNGGCP